MQAPPEHVDANFQILAHRFWICIKLASSPPCWQCMNQKVKMQECKTKHINSYMSFSNRPNLVSKVRNETKITHMNHSIVKALPQVICENTSMWQSKIFRFNCFTKRRLASHVKAYPCHTWATNMHTVQRSYKDIKLSAKDHCKHP
jgi:hypothetical protein